MNVVDKVDIVQVAFAVSLVVAGIALAAAALDRVSERVLQGIAMAIGVGALAGWVLFALDPGTALAVARTQVSRHEARLRKGQL